jgi:hypothetical protein
MTARAAQLIIEVKALGGELSARGNSLRIVSDAPLPGELLSRLRAAKPEVLAEVRRAIRWDAQDWQAFFDERAGILEHDQGKSRKEAERIAFECCVIEWQNRNLPVANNPNMGCTWCGKAKDAGVIVPFGFAESATWLHHECWRPWSDKRKAEAIEALAAMDLEFRHGERP